MIRIRIFLALSFFIAPFAWADINTPESKDRRIAELERKNALLRAELLLLRNKLAHFEKVDNDRASDVELRAREAIRQLLPDLKLVPNPDGGFPDLVIPAPGPTAPTKPPSTDPQPSPTPTKPGVKSEPLQ
ncbi:MAG: hypothetical protein AAF585_08350 [Verrucomicrobiota bacterium]